MEGRDPVLLVRRDGGALKCERPLETAGKCAQHTPGGPGDRRSVGGKAGVACVPFNKGQLWQQLAEFVHIAQRQRKRAQSKTVRSERLYMDKFTTNCASNLYPKSGQKKAKK